jgi:energy-coupling factor transporter ATP-binding protein EcfA2
MPISPIPLLPTGFTTTDPHEAVPSSRRRSRSTSPGTYRATTGRPAPRQLALARVLLADFPVVVLDEPTEHLDEPTAAALTRDLLEETRGRSVLLITHRTASLTGVDEAVCLTDGKIDYPLAAPRSPPACSLAGHGLLAGADTPQRRRRRLCDPFIMSRSAVSLPCSAAAAYRDTSCRGVSAGFAGAAVSADGAGTGPAAVPGRHARALLRR